MFIAQLRTNSHQLRCEIGGCVCSAPLEKWKRKNISF
jgi:hypothetical protein